jgi:RNA polymerase sigma factor (sigma-70 family)
VSAVPFIGEVGIAPEADLTRALYERHAAQIYRFCFHQLGRREEAEDAVQSTFLNAFRGIKGGVVPDSEAAWLFKIAHNVCLTRRRSSWRRDRVESPTDFEMVEELAPAPPRRDDELIGLQDVLERLPEQQRRAILLREWQGLSYREIGQELRLSQAAVETLIFRARRSLAEGLEAPVKRRRRRLASGGLGSLLSAAQSFLGAGGAVKVAAVVAAAGAGGVVATVPVRDRHAPPRLTVPQLPTVVHLQRKAAVPVSTIPAARPAPTIPKVARPRRHQAVRHPAPAVTHVPPGQAKKTQAPQTTVATPAPVRVVRHSPPGRVKKTAAVSPPAAAPKAHGRSSAPGQVKKQAAPPAPPVTHGNGQGQKNPKK